MPDGAVAGNTYSEPTGMKPSYVGQRSKKMGNGKWMQDAVSKPGSFTKYAKGNHESMSKAISQGEKSKNPLTRKRANLAKVFRAIAAKRKKAGA